MKKENRVGRSQNNGSIWTVFFLVLSVAPLGGCADSVPTGPKDDTTFRTGLEVEGFPKLPSTPTIDSVVVYSNLGVRKGAVEPLISGGPGDLGCVFSRIRLGRGPVLTQEQARKGCEGLEGWS